jgi:ribosome-interacting GTPase 1
MPANLPPQYSKVEEEYRRASSPQERLDLLRELFRLLPKHKGTEKMQSDLKQKISRARDELEHGKAGGKKAGPSHRVPHEGAGQVALVGPPNAGKSALLAALTHAHPEVAPYPFTTRVPQPGMMPFEDVQVQLVDLPPITRDFLEPWVSNIVRSADAALFVLDLGDDDLIEAAQAVLDRLAATHTELVGALPFDDEDEAVRHVPTRLVANKADAPGADDRLEILREFVGDRFPVLLASAATGAGLDGLRRETYALLDVIRVYTKVPGRPADRTHPYTLPRGATVLDLAVQVHRDLEHSLKFAKVWGSGVFDGQTVKRDHELQDADLVELHA